MPDGSYHLGLTGYPLSHSLSPAIHNAALATLGLKGEYRVYPAAPNSPELARLLDLLRQGKLHGLNVTIPHKQTVLPLLDALEPAAQQTGAVNVIFRRGDQLIGDNSDLPGFLADLSRQLPLKTLPGQPHALVLGAGGSARAVCTALNSAGWQIHLAARRVEQAAALAADLNLLSAACLPLEPQALFSTCQTIHLIVNTTPLGMSPHPEDSPWPEKVPFPTGACLYDLVYNPPVTRLVQQARAAGLTAVNGAGMLVEQAALALERWTALPAPRPVMQQAMQHALAELISS